MAKQPSRDLRVALLDEQHDRSSFTCGAESLDRYLKTQAAQDVRRKANAVAANTDGKREIVGLHIGPSEAETFWAGFLKSQVRRGLRGVKLVISDAHARAHDPAPAEPRDRAFAEHPARFVNKAPVPFTKPTATWINQPAPKAVPEC